MQITAAVLAVAIDTTKAVDPVEQFAIARGPTVLDCDTLHVEGWAAYAAATYPGNVGGAHWPDVAAARLASILARCTRQLERRGIALRG